MQQNYPDHRRLPATAFTNIVSLYYMFYLALDLLLDPSEKATGSWYLGERENEVRRTVYRWCHESIGGLTRHGEWKLEFLLDLIGDDVLREEGKWI